MAKYWTKKCDTQQTCEDLMASDYYSCCMCGANGDHSELDAFREEEWEKYCEMFIC